MEAGNGQHNEPDSLRKLINNSKNDTTTYRILIEMSEYYTYKNWDSVLSINERLLKIDREHGSNISESKTLWKLAVVNLLYCNYEVSFKYLETARKIAEDPHINETSIFYNPYSDLTPHQYRFEYLARIYTSLSSLFGKTNNTEEQINYLKKAIQLKEEIDSPYRWWEYMLLGKVLLGQNKLDSALQLFQKSLELTKVIKTNESALPQLCIGDVYLKRGEKKQALANFNIATNYSIIHNKPDILGDSYLRLYEYFMMEGNADSTLHYVKFAKRAFESTSPSGSNIEKFALVNLYLYKAYDMNNMQDSANKYLILSASLKDSLNTLQINGLSAFLNSLYQNKLTLEKAEKIQVAYRNKIRTYTLLSISVIMLLVAAFFIRNNRTITKIKLKIERAYHQLENTQQELIQREKMASLGELTAGIAHEIQNPLNFVNNFSDVNKELLVELKQELEKGNVQEVKVIANDLIDNEEKIILHGRRADAIVKSMLQHSRASSGKKEPTDLNALADEYLRLAYHGMRAKDKSFNATLHTDFDTSLEKINIIPQDIGRVLLNLVNNAFYAVHEKKQSAPDGYEPAVSVSTKKTDGKIAITVRDNGNGIPDKIKDKIFQPFFTTKPTSKGTGLGLSLSYDIVKAHGGELKVETKEGEGSAFSMQLPLN
jgi:signal transduction histidine kinase